MRRTLLVMASFTIPLMLLGCGGSGASGGEDAPERLRIMHLAPDAPRLDILIEDEEIVTDLGYAEITEYFEVLEGANQVSVERDDEVLPIVDQSITFPAGKQSTLFLFEEDDDDAVMLLLVEDTIEKPEARMARLKIGNLSPNVPSVDVYLVRPGDSIRDRDPDATVAFKGFSDYFEFGAGQFQVKVTEAGEKSVLVDTGELAIAEGETRSLVLFEKPGGGVPLRFAYLLDSAQ